MLEFDASFLAAETREDFYIDATMKSVWAAELEVLQEIAVICERHDLKWTAAFGTLLGAVRHEGFIPWDDDLDIWMLREDYQKLLSYLPDELPKEYYIRSCTHKNGFEQYQTCVYNASTISISPERLQKYHGCPFMVGVDIFPIDRLPENEKDCRIQAELIKLTEQTVRFLKTPNLSEENKRILWEALHTLEDFCHFKVDKKKMEQNPMQLASFLYKKLNEKAMEYPVKPGCNLVVWSSYARYNTMIFKEEWFRETILLPFEGFLLPAPKDYDPILTYIYGDYSIRCRGGSCHDYPCYKHQLAWLEEEIRRIKQKAAELEEKLS